VEDTLNEALNEELNGELNEELKFLDLITIDPYYSIKDYNEALNALDNNKISYDEWISTIAPYNFFLNLNGEKPIMMNYDKPTKTDWIKLVSKVKGLVPTDQVLLFRRGDKQTAAKQYINNDVFNLALKADITIVFQYDNKEQLARLSKSYGRIYPIGKYINGSKRLAICFDANIKNTLTPNSLLLENSSNKLGALESEINYKVLRNRDKIIKWVKTPYWINGVFKQTRPTSPMKI